MNAIKSSITSAITEPHRLSALADTGLMDSAPEEAFDRLTRLVRAVLKSPVALVSLVDDHRQFFKSQQGLPEPVATKRETPLSHSFCQHVVTTGRPLVVEDAPNHPVVSKNLAVPELGVIAYLGVPLTDQEGHVLGSLCAIDGETRSWTEDDLQALRDIAQMVMSEIALRHEIKQRKEAEQYQQVLIAELHHRVKNTLATVQALVHMSVRSSNTLEDFRQGIGPRIASLAHTHTLLSDRSFDAVGFTELLRSELGPYDEGHSIAMEGQDFAVSAQIAVTLGMAVHELTTNAVKYGALRKHGGTISIGWTMMQTPQGRQLDLTWRERGGPVVSPPKRQGFGSVLLDRLIVRQLKGSLDLAFRPEGLRATLRAFLPAADEKLPAQS